MTDLSVNIDHVATLRQARGTEYPDPVEAAVLAEAAGAAGITAHLRVDRRHVQDTDLFALRRRVTGKFNLEMSVAPEMVAIALDVRPNQVTLVPERPEEVTTEGGLDLQNQGIEIRQAVVELAREGIEVSLFLDPDPDQIARAAEWREEVRGFEINTDTYTSVGASETVGELDRVAKAARLGDELGLAVYAGHGLTTQNVGPVSALPEVLELNIGHYLISRSVAVGLPTAVAEMLEAMNSAAGA